ncbi:Rid family hydrolase [Branchiibius sp. NY16-3462-2]|uniref:RidA family protein n=1 Tax=Branchiibius sp. NY16-3462-2 TaxID=1807500 RepID=UPI000796707D|nr:Rid family hydrolase [Branchiibius sp. NY16-3462-2]KYH46205.1 enamine deaminase RidA [Branchiibius sp. NY16-3462-2]
MAPAVRLIRADALSDVAQYAYAATVEPGARLVFLAGACPLEHDGSIAAVGDYTGQAAKCVETLTEALRAAGVTITDVVSTRVLVASSERSDLVDVWQVVRAAFGDHDVPSTLLGVTVLGYEHQLVEIEAVAAVADPDGNQFCVAGGTDEG